MDANTTKDDMDNSEYVQTGTVDDTEDTETVGDTQTGTVDDVSVDATEVGVVVGHDTIFVGGKPIMTYVNATLTQIKSAPTVTLKARGRRIKQAVDVALTIAKRMNAVGYSIGDVRISSNPMQTTDGRSRNISTIEIDIQKTPV